MKSKEQIFNDIAKRNMEIWNNVAFEQDYPRLYKTIMQSMEEIVYQHVSAALQAAADKVVIITPAHPEEPWIDKSTIIRAYPLKNI